MNITDQMQLEYKLNKYNMNELIKHNASETSDLPSSEGEDKVLLLFFRDVPSVLNL